MCFRGRFLSVVVVGATALLFGVSGCSKPANNAGKTDAGKTTTASAESGHNYKGRDWCAEHGVPESDCALCNAEIAASYKQKGDWCAEHDRPESQCFICNPGNKAKFAAAYKLKYGEDPPAISEEHDAHDHAEGDKGKG